MRVLIGALLAANLAVAVVAFHPFGGSAEDLRRQESALRSQLAALQARVAISKRLTDKVVAARRDGDQFLTRYVVDRQVASSAIYDELLKMGREAGVRSLGMNDQYQDIEGSDTLQMLTIQAGYEGSYDKLAKLVYLLDRSSRFLIIESMNVAAGSGNAAQAGQLLSVQFKIDTFVRAEPRQAEPVGAPGSAPSPEGAPGRSPEGGPAEPGSNKAEL